MTGEVRVRQSILSTFNDCPQQAAFALELPARFGTHRTGGGTLLHRAIAQALREMKAAGEAAISPEQATVIFDEVMRQDDAPASTDDPLADRDVGVPLHEVRDMRVAMRSWAMHWHADPRSIKAIERRYDVPLPSGTLTTQLDALQISADGERAKSTDWKSGWRPPPLRVPDPLARFPRQGGSERGEDYFQQRVHALTIFHYYPRVQVVETDEFWVRHAAARTEDPHRPSVYYRHEVPELVAEFDALLARFIKSREAGEWAISEGEHCQNCPRVTACPAWKRAKHVTVLQTPQDADRAIRAVTYLSALLEQHRRQLEVYTQAHGPQPARSRKGDPRYYGPALKTVTVKPSADEVRQAVAEGRDPGELYTTTTRVEIGMHKPERLHPHAKAAREEAPGV